MYNNFPYQAFNTPYNSIGNINNAGNFLGIAKKFNWDSFLNNAQRTLNVINQAMPIYNQVKPIFRNAGTLFKVIGELNSTAPITSSVVASTAPQFFA